MILRLTLWTLPVLVLLIAFGIWRSRAYRRDARPASTHLILIGASIGQAWHLAGWPLRANAPAFTAESLAQWQFDKTEAVDAVLLRPQMKFALSRAWLQSFLRPPQKPDIVLLKECSSYFPGPLAEYEARMSRWVARLQERGIRPVLATVVPVTRARAASDPGKQSALLEFNRWVRQYAREQHLPMLDLEATLREETGDAYLRADFAAPDGSHLNAAAYARLDHTLWETLCSGAAPVGEPASCRRTRL
jgi:lysophospholipase L1-like esterase